jgi:hypothetical protein
VAGATPLPKNGVAGPPPFWPRGGFGHPIRPVWGGQSHPQAFEGGPATLKATKKKKKKKTKWVCAVGGGRTTPKGLGWLRPPPTTTPRPLGVVRPPPTAQTHFVFFFFSWWLSGWPDHPQRPGGGFSHPIPPYGVAEATPWPKRGWSGHPIFGQGGGSSHPRFPFFFFNFFLKKKKLKSEMGQNYVVLGKTVSFWASPKRRSFGVKGIMGRFLQKGPK